MADFPAIRNVFRRLWNLLQQPFFGHLSPSARLHPAARCDGRRQIFIGPLSRISAHAHLATGEPGASIRIGERCLISPNAMLMTYGGFIELGNDCSVNPFAILYGHGGLTIGNGVRIAAGSVIVPAQHNFSDIDIPIHQQGLTRKGIVIEDDVWIGANTVILDGVRIGNGSVIAAGAVVSRDVAPFSVMGGVPARLIRKRTEEAPTASSLPSPVHSLIPPCGKGSTTKTGPGSFTPPPPSLQFGGL